MSWTEQQIESTWNKGQVVDRVNPGIWRKDACGAWIRRDQYDNKASLFGWSIGLVQSAAAGGTDEVPNLRPMQWKNAEVNTNGRLTCAVLSQGGLNVDLT